MARTATLEEVGDRLLSREDAATFLGIDATTLDRWANRGIVKRLKAPTGTVRFRLSDLEAVFRPVDSTDEVAAARQNEAQDGADTWEW